jgi:hypothetical protein
MPKDLVTSIRITIKLQGKQHSRRISSNASVLIMNSIVNPLAHLSNEAITQDVTIFAEENGLSHLAPLLIKGALVAKDPALFDELRILSDEDKTAIRNEVLHKWRQPKALYFTVALTCIGAAVQSVTLAFIQRYLG